MNKFLIVLFLITFFTLEGCSKNEGNKSSNNSGQPQKELQNPPANNSAPSQSGDIKGPDFTLKSTDGKDVKLSNYKGKIVVIDFWATWCPPCRKGIPDLISIQKEYPNDVVVLGISLDTETKADVIPFMKNYGINYPILYGNAEVTQLYGGVEAIPTSFILDRNGNIVAQHVGLVAKSEFTDKIEKLLKEKS